MLPLLRKLLEVKKPASGLPGTLLAQYGALGAAAGFRVEPMEKGLLLIGKTARLALRVEFGNRREFFNTITALRESDSDIKIIVTSSNSRSLPMEAVYTVLKKKLLEKSRWAIIDIEGRKEPMLLNFHSAGPGQEHARPAALSLEGQPGEKQSPAPPAPASSRRARPGEGGRTHEGRGGLVKTKNYGLQPVSARPRRKKIYGKRRKRG